MAPHMGMFLLVLASVRGERPPVRLAELGLRDRHSFETPIIRSANVVIALGSRSSPAPLRRRCGCGCGSASL
eukprot:COSAG04_NODE_1247_length_7582_cov_4.668181_2_plen_72_part_00